MQCHIELKGVLKCFDFDNTNTVLASCEIRQQVNMLRHMSVTNLFDVVSCARSKFGKAASNSEQNLRQMVLHANLIDGKSKTHLHLAED